MHGFYGLNYAFIKLSQSVSFYFWKCFISSSEGRTFSNPNYIWIVLIIEVTSSSRSRFSSSDVISSMLLCSGEKTDVRHREVQTACFSPAAFLVTLVVCLPQTAIKRAVFILYLAPIGKCFCRVPRCPFCFALARFQDVMACLQAPRSNIVWDIRYVLMTEDSPSVY